MYKYLIILFATVSLAQTPFSKENPKNTLAIKGCAYINLLDGGYGSIIGIEKGFFKNHSLGIKYINNHFTPHRENSEYEPVDYTDNKDVSVIFEYKYYLNFNKFRERTGVSFYSSLSYKTGENTIENDRNYPHDYYYRSINYNYFGPAIGTSIIMSESKRWTIDTQIGYLFGTKKVNTDYEIPNQFELFENYTTSFVRFEIMIAYNINW